jgi:hypothetical protein
VVTNGRYAFVEFYIFQQCGFAGLSPRLDVVDFTQPEYPTLVGSIDTPDSATFLAVSDGRAYMKTPNGMDVIDVREPSAPVRLGTYSGTDAAADVATAGDFMLIAAQELGLVSVELEPQLVMASPVLNTNTLTLRWTGGEGIKLQEAPRLSHPTWSDIDGTYGLSHLDLPLPSVPLFFRAVQR